MNLSVERKRKWQKKLVGEKAEKKSNEIKKRTAQLP